jgi:hypothetical protein
MPVLFWREVDLISRVSLPVGQIVVRTMIPQLPVTPEWVLECILMIGAVTWTWTIGALSRTEGLSGWTTAICSLASLAEGLAMVAGILWCRLTISGTKLTADAMAFAAKTRKPA